MTKVFAAFTFLIVIISTASVYSLKQTTYDLEAKKESIRYQILKDRQAIKVLKAEMAYRSRPERLERLSNKHLMLEAAENMQLVSHLGDLTRSEGVRQASLPVDNFRPYFPRKKPNFNVASHQVREERNVPIRAKANSTKVSSGVQKAAQEVETPKKGFFDRILAKYGNQ